MNTSANNVGGCPSLEELSAWHDGMGAAGLTSHVEACSACQQVLASFRRIDAATRRVAQASPDLAERIKERCRVLPKREPLFLVLWNQPLLRWAAAGIVATAALLLAYQRMDAGRTSPAVAANEAAPTSVAASVMVAENAPPPVPAVPPAQDEGGRTRAGDDGALVVAGSEPVRASQITRAAADPSASGADGMRQALLVPSRVRHVWVVKDLEAAKKQVLASLPADASLSVATAEDGTVSIQALLADRALQSLVDTLDGAGMSLVSPTARQPGRAKDLVVTGRMVRYDLDLVPGGR